MSSTPVIASEKFVLLLVSRQPFPANTTGCLEAVVERIDRRKVSWHWARGIVAMDSVSKNIRDVKVPFAHPLSLTSHTNF